MQHDGRSPGGQQPPDAYVMQAKIDMLFNVLGEVRTVLKSVEETVSIVKVFDLQIKQQGHDFSRLETDVRDQRRQFEEMGRKLLDKIREVEQEATNNADAATEIATDTKNSLQNKVSYVQGALAAITVLGAVLYAIAIWWGSRYIETTDDNERYIHTLKTLDAEQHLRDSMQKVDRIDLQNPPEVVSGERKPRSRQNTQQGQNKNVPRL